jgi:hypothetical protein
MQGYASNIAISKNKIYAKITNNSQITMKNVLLVKAYYI